MYIKITCFNYTFSEMVFKMFTSFLAKQGDLLTCIWVFLRYLFQGFRDLFIHEGCETLFHVYLHAV